MNIRNVCLASLNVVLPPGDAKERGRPSEIARNAASEKFKTVVIDIMVEAKQRLSALRSVGKGAVNVARRPRPSRLMGGNAVITRKSKGERVCQKHCQ